MEHQKLGKGNCLDEDHANHQRCLNLKSELTIKGQGSFEEITFNKDSWIKVVEAVHAVDDQIPIWKCIDLYSVCPRSIITPLSFDIYNLFIACGGFSRISNPFDYYKLPALYVDGVRTIQTEMSRIKEYKESE